jgi:hypothetical protein
MSDSAPADDRTNPKDRVGRLKVDLSLFPPAAHIHGAHAFMDGARKYGPFNWRERSVSARVYVSAAMRHLADFLDGEDVAADSGAHHLGHGIACLAIILDALETGNLIDDRPAKGAAPAILGRLNAAIVEREAARLDAEGAPAVKAPEPPKGAGVLADEVDPYPAGGDGDPLALKSSRVRNVILNASARHSPLYDCRCHPGARCNLGPSCEAQCALASASEHEGDPAALAFARLATLRRPEAAE